MTATATTVSLSWEFWATLLATAGLMSAAWTTLWSWISDWRKSITERANTALRAAIALEKYAIAAWQAFYSGHEHLERTGKPWFSEIPEVVGLPEDSAWQHVNVRLTDEVLSFRNRISVSQVKAQHAKYFEGNDFDVESEAIELGKAAWELAAKLRSHHRLPAQATLKRSMEGFLT